MSFYVIDGPNGAGKTTLLKSLAEKGYVTFSSPYGTSLSSYLRDICRGVGDWKNISSDVQLLLFAATRTDEYINRVEPFKDIMDIIADRWWTSTYVYQVCNGGSSNKLFENTIYSNEKIDKIVLLDADDNLLADRVIKEREKNKSHSFCRWTQDVELMKRIATIYREDLTEYIKSKNIKLSTINTTNLTEEQVLQAFLTEIKN
jgi:thymidylate kinase